MVHFDKHWLQEHKPWLIMGAIGLMILLAPGALGHDLWINKKRLVDPQSNQWCCNEHDCEPVRAGGVSEQGSGYFLITETGETIPHGRVIWSSEDGFWWRCRNQRDNSTRCLIGPPQSF